MTERVAAITWRHPKLVLVAIAVFVVFAGAFAGSVEEHLKAAGFTDPDSESEHATKLLRGELGYDPAPGIVVLLSDPDDDRLAIAHPGVRAEVARLARELGKARHVARVVNPLRELEALERLAAGDPTPPPQGALVDQLRSTSPLIAADGRSLILLGQLDTPDPEDDGGEAANDVEELLSSDRFEIGTTGFAVGFNEVEDQVREDLTRAEMIAFPVLFILLLVVFRGVIAAFIPLLVGVVSILGTFLVLRLMSELADTSLFALNITTALSLGLSVDYALLMISRYREELERDGATEAAHRRMVTTAGRTVLFSGFTVAVALLALVIFPQRFLYSIGVAGASVGIVSSLIALLGVSAIVSLLGERINALPIRKGRSVSAASGGWYRLASAVMRRPILVAVGSAGVMLALAFPFLSTTLTGPSAEAVPPSKPSYDVTERIEAEYPSDVNEAITVTVTGRASRAELAALHGRISRVAGIEVANEFSRAGPNLAYANLGAAGKALASGPQDAVREIRNLRPPSGAEILLSGNTARFLDQKESLVDHLPYVAGIVAVTTFILLFLLTGSIILPVKTLLMNVLTLAATIGVLVLAFGEGLLESVLDYTGPSAVEVITMVLLFAIIFGLATDYAVLVMARIKEYHDKGLPNEEAVALGIGHTGRVISAAALCLAVVFLAFATSEIFFMKQAAIGQAAGVLLDATIVRALLVPSLMRLFGDANWWAPKPMARFQSRFGFKEG